MQCTFTPGGRSLALPMSLFFQCPFEYSVQSLEYWWHLVSRQHQICLKDVWKCSMLLASVAWKEDSCFPKLQYQQKLSQKFNICSCIDVETPRVVGSWIDSIGSRRLSRFLDRFIFNHNLHLRTTVFPRRKFSFSERESTTSTNRCRWEPSKEQLQPNSPSQVFCGFKCRFGVNGLCNGMFFLCEVGTAVCSSAKSICSMFGTLACLVPSFCALTKFGLKIADWVLWTKQRNYSPQ